MDMLLLGASLVVLSSRILFRQLRGVNTRKESGSRVIFQNVLRWFGENVSIAFSCMDNDWYAGCLFLAF